jgi:hypothetical protein
MKTTRLVIAATAGLLALAACQKSPTAEGQNAGDNMASAIDNQADTLDATAANVADSMENQADNLNSADNAATAADAAGATETNAH